MKYIDQVTTTLEIYGTCHDTKYDRIDCLIKQLQHRQESFI